MFDSADEGWQLMKSCSGSCLPLSLQGALGKRYTDSLKSTRTSLSGLVMFSALVVYVQHEQLDDGVLLSSDLRWSVLTIH